MAAQRPRCASVLHPANASAREPAGRTPRCVGGSGRGRAPAAATAMAETRVANLALQGGGSHGAFTWGVLDALLEDEPLMESTA